MSFKSTIFAAAAAAVLAGAAWAEDKAGIMVHDPYARSSMANAKTGAAFMVLMNKSGTDDRLIDAKSDIAKKVELHTHIENDEGVMRMTQIEGGIELPAGGKHMMQRGGDHVMFMGLTQPLVHGETVSVTLIFEQAGEVQVEIPVDLERKPKHGAMNH